MSPFARFVSRKVLAVAALFAVLAASLVGFLAARGDSGAGASSAGRTSQVDAQTLDAALTDAARTDPAAVGGPVVGSVTGPVVGSDDGRSRLRADLESARRLTGDARRAALAGIRTKARDGAYGAGVERRADRRQVHRQLFLALLPDNLQADLKALRAAPADQRRQLRADILDKAVAGDYGADVQKAAKQLEALRTS